MFEPNQIFIGEYSPAAARWCNKSGQYHIEEVEADEYGRRRFQIVENARPTEEQLAELERMQAEAESEARRVPDLEDATVELADYVVSLEERIAELETRLEVFLG